MKKYALYWTAPVAIKFEGETILVDGPLPATDLLEGVWPDKSGRHYLAALRACGTACGLRGGLGSSRELFVAAALAADLLDTQPILRPVEAAALAGSSPSARQTDHTTQPHAGTPEARHTIAASSGSSISL